jgi:hypothetical protein
MTEPQAVRARRVRLARETQTLDFDMIYREWGGRNADLD